LELVEWPMGDEPALVEDDDLVCEVFDLGEKVAGEEHGVASAGTVPQQLS